MNLSTDFCIGYGFGAVTVALYFVGRYAVVTFIIWRRHRSLSRALDRMTDLAGA